MINTRRNALIALAVVATVGSAFIAYVTHVSDRITAGVCGTDISDATIRHLWTAFLLEYGIAPSAVLVVLNLLVVRRMAYLRRQRLRQIRPDLSTLAGTGASSIAAAPASTSSSVDPSYELTNTVVVQTSVFFVLVTPALIVYAGENLTETSDDDGAMERLVQVLDEAHHSVNFYLCLVSSASFRRRAKTLFVDFQRRIKLFLCPATPAETRENAAAVIDLPMGAVRGDGANANNI